MFKEILYTQIKDTTCFKVLYVRVYIFFWGGAASNKLNVSKVTPPPLRDDDDFCKRKNNRKCSSVVSFLGFITMFDDFFYTYI